MEYKYTQNPNAGIPIILLDQYIGVNEKGVKGIDGGQFAREVLALKSKGKTHAEVWINSKGGQWSEGVNIVGSMRNSGIDFTTKNLGFVDSTAGHIFQAGNKRVWMDYGLGLIHEIQGQGSATIIEGMNESVATLLCKKSNRTAAQVREMMASETIMTAKMAEEYGFCDMVAHCTDILSFTNSSDVNEVTAFGQEQTKKLLSKNRNMEQLNAILGLTNEASEAAQILAINKIIEAKNAAETALTLKETELSKVNTTLSEVNGKLLVAQNEILTATNAAKQTAAVALVKEHTGKRIPNDPALIQSWTDAAVRDYAGTKTLIEGLNLSVEAPKPEYKRPEGSSKVVISAADYANYNG